MESRRREDHQKREDPQSGPFEADPAREVVLINSDDEEVIDRGGRKPHPHHFIFY